MRGSPIYVLASTAHGPALRQSKEPHTEEMRFIHAEEEHFVLYHASPQKKTYLWFFEKFIEAVHSFRNFILNAFFTIRART